MTLRPPHIGHSYWIARTFALLHLALYENKLVSREKNEGSNPKPYYGRLGLDLPLDERCLTNPKPINRLLTPKMTISIGTWKLGHGM